MQVVPQLSAALVNLANYPISEALNIQVQSLADVMLHYSANLSQQTEEITRNKHERKGTPCPSPTCLWQPSTMISFCCGDVLANTISVWYFRMSSSCSEVRSFRSPPCTTQALASLWGGRDTESHYGGGSSIETRRLGSSVWSVPRVNLVDRDVQTRGDVLDGLVAFRDDAHTLGDGLCCDWMITCYHDDLEEGRKGCYVECAHPFSLCTPFKFRYELYLDSGAPAFAYSVRHGGTRGVNHGHEADEAQVLRGEVHLVGVESEAVWELVVGQVVVAETWMG